VINLVKRLELGGQVYPVVADEVRLALNAVGRGQFHVRAEEPIEAGTLARYTLALDGRAYPVLLGAVTEPSQRGPGLWRVSVRDLAAALERPVPLALRHVTSARAAGCHRSPLTAPGWDGYERRARPVTVWMPDAACSADS
jgi:hypothetical protein